MKGYRVFTQDMMGYEGDKVLYTTNYELAIKTFNEYIKKFIKNNNVITDKGDFGDIKAEFKKHELTPLDEPIEIICMKAPYIIHRRGKSLTASLFYDYRCSYEYDEYDTGEELIIIEEIEIIN